MNLEVSSVQMALLQDLGEGDPQLGLKKLIQAYVDGAPAVQLEFLKQYVYDNYNIVNVVTIKRGRIPYKRVYALYQKACAKNGIDTIGKLQFRKYLNTIPGVSSRYAGGNVLTVFGLEEKPL